MGTPLPPRHCIVCGAAFQPVSSKHLHCSISCVGGQPQTRHIAPGGRSQFLRKYKTLLIALPVVGVAVVLGANFLMSSRSTQNAAYDLATMPRPQSDFKALVGKSQDEVKAAVGPADSYGGDIWMYYARGIDPQANKVDDVKVQFKAGRVSDVTFRATLRIIPP
ncbi:MAG TPA: hypothetical protein VM533_19715 [Fimbriiglobus sp.]|jgi:hypothetical protein|nr:hypothetical protein [Fimbriiglobus sp.]